MKASADEVVCLPFPSPEEAGPTPIHNHVLTFLVAGRPIRYYAEVWNAEDVRRLPFPTTPHPEHPEQRYSIRFFDLIARQEITPASVEEVRAALAAAKRGRSRETSP